jgi:hypothetical protein
MTEIQKVKIQTRKVKILKKKPSIISDGFCISPTAAIEIDASLMSDYEYFYVQRAIAKGAVRVVQYETVSENDEVRV